MKTWVPHWNGNKNDILNPDPDSIKVEDFAYTLSRISHWNGRCKPFLPISQHCCMVADNLDYPHKLGGLFHDVPEYALGDVSRPLKYQLGRYQEIEKTWNQVVNKKFGIEVDHPAIKLVDSMVLYAECIAVMPGCDPEEVCESFGLTDSQKTQARGWAVVPWSMEQAEKEFLMRYDLRFYWAVKAVDEREEFIIYNSSGIHKKGDPTPEHPFKK